MSPRFTNAETDNYSVKYVLIALSIFTFSNLNSKEFNKDSCYIYYTTYKDQLLLNHLESVSIGDLNKSDKILFLFYMSLAHWVESNPEKSIKYLVDGYSLVEEYGAPDSIKWKYFDQLANVYRRAESKNRKKAIDFIDRSIKLKIESHAHPDHLAKSYLIKANIYYSVEEKVDSALYYYTLAYEMNTLESNKFLCLGNIASLSLHLNQLDSVESYLKQSIAYHLRKNGKKSSVLSSGTLAIYYGRIGKNELAKNMLDSLVQLCHDNQWNNGLKSMLHNQITHAKSIEDYKSQVFWSDSLYAFNARHFDMRIAELTDKFTLENKLARAHATTYKNQLWLSILGGTTGTLCLCLFGLYKYFSLRRQKVEESLRAAKIKADFDATKARMVGEQKERESIASVLHDQVASLLTAADLHLHIAQKKDPLAQGINKAVGIIKDLNLQVRDLSHQLLSPTLVNYGLEVAIDNLVDGLQSNQISITYLSKLGSKRYDQTLEKFIYQSASEFLNIAMHQGKTTQANLVISEVDSQLLLIVTHNGDIVNKEDLGLTQIQSRAAALDGQFSITQEPHRTELKLEMPFEEVFSS